MRIRVPPHFEGWRKFAGEIVIIVIAVLIALAAEQAVEARHWRQQAEIGREALRSDARTVIANAHERKLQAACLDRRFDGIAGILDGASRTGRLPPVGSIDNPSLRLWQIVSWDSLVASQTSLHMPREEMLAVANLHRFAERIEQENNDEIKLWARLHAIVGPGRPIGDAEIAGLRASLSGAILAAKLMTLASSQLRTGVIATRLLSGADIARVERELARRPEWSSDCAPGARIAPTYRSSPLSIELRDMGTVR